MKIGSVKEIKNNEFRVGLTPDNVRAYVSAGHEVLIEKGAGIGSLVPKMNCGSRNLYASLQGFFMNTQTVESLSAKRRNQ